MKLGEQTKRAEAEGVPATRAASDEIARQHHKRARCASREVAQVAQIFGILYRYRSPYM